MSAGRVITWRAGDVARDASGQVVLYARSFTDESWWWCAAGFLRDDEVPRPLTPLVRDGKPVQARR